MWAGTTSLLKEGVAAVRRLVDRGIQEAGAPKGALRTATIKMQAHSLIDALHVLD
jgi:hypothetical protein